MHVTKDKRITKQGRCNSVIKARKGYQNGYGSIASKIFRLDCENEQH